MYAYDYSQDREHRGVVSALVSLAGVCGPESMVGVDGPAAGPEVPVHCGTLMELVTPAVGPLSTGYTFEPPVEPIRLPPVWRCGCGFQLDAWDSTPLTGNSKATDAAAALTP